MSISRRDLLKSLAATTVATMVPSVAVSASEMSASNNNKTLLKSGKRPNLLIVFPDEMRTQALGFMNEDPSLTPFLDKFAKESVVLRENVSNYPLCSPFRGTLMTGQYANRNGVHGNCHTAAPGSGSIGGSDFGVELKKVATTWSDIMAKQGYAMGYIGKWHLDCPEAPFVESPNNPMRGKYWNDWTPPEKRHGFDFWHANGTSPSHLNPRYWTNETTRDKPIIIDQWSAEHEADTAIKYLRNVDGKYRDNDKPFALVVSMNAPHSPYDQTPKKYLDRFAGQTSRSLNTRPNVQWDGKYGKKAGPEHFKSYLAMVNGIDEQFERIINELDSSQLSEDTLVLFFSDHGCCMGSHGKKSKNQVVEESMRTPMMFRWPGKLKPKMDDILFSAGDIYPTMFGLLGLSELIPDTVEGYDYSRTIQGLPGDELPTSQLYIYMPYGGQSYGRRGIRNEQYTLEIERRAGKTLKYRLYDRMADPYQMTNIAADNKELIEQLIEDELMPWLEHTGDPWRATELPMQVIKGYT